MNCRTVSIFLLVMFTVVTTAGCGKNSTSTPNMNSYSRDGLLGTSQSNPNLPTSPTYHNYASDVNMIHDTVKQIQGVQDSVVVLRGADAFVTIDLPNETAIEDAMRIKREAQDKVSAMMPRYHVKVNVSKNGLLKGRQ